MKSQPNIPI